MSAVSLTVAAPLLAVLAAATLCDLRTRRIPNGLTFGGAALGLLINAATLGASALGLAALGFGICLACMLPFYLRGGMAAGDVKLMAMVGAFLGPTNGFAAWLLTLLAGALLAVLVIAMRKVQQAGLPLLYAAASFSPLAARAARPMQRLDKIPYAAAIALGTFAVVSQSPWLTNLFR